MMTHSNVVVLSLSESQRSISIMQSQFSTVEEALTQLLNGGYIILADNEDRETKVT